MAGGPHTQSPESSPNIPHRANNRTTPTSNGSPLTRKTEIIRSSGNRRSPRFVESSGGDKPANSIKSDGRKCESPPAKKRKPGRKDSFFIGDPVLGDEARRHDGNEGPQNNGLSPKNKTDDEDEDELILNVKCNYSQAEILKSVFDLGDCVHVKGPKGDGNYVGRILEFFETTDGEDYFRVQWFFRAEDTIVKDEGRNQDKKQLFYSTLMNDNLLDCIVSKVKVIQLAPNVALREKSVPPCDYYFDMKYSVDYSTFSTMVKEHRDPCPPTPLIACQCTIEETSNEESSKAKLALLDMYSGCGGMSTGLCFGAKACGVDLVTKWALDSDQAACESLRLNHPATQIRNEAAEDFLDLLKEWDSMCRKYANYEEKQLKPRGTKEADKNKRAKTDGMSSGEYEVEQLVDICYGDPNETGKRQLMFKVRWVGYGPSDDTWESIECLRNCQERIRDFVQRGMKENILPRPGDVAVICGGPPCQGISGYNRFRNVQSPLDSFMLESSNGVCMENTAPVSPPTHDVVIQYGFPSNFERNVVAYDEGQSQDLGKAILLSDAISDLPPVANDEKREKMPYKKAAETDFQNYIRAAKCDMMGSPSSDAATPKKPQLCDHLPYPLNDDDYLRVCNIPKRKGANFRDLPGIIIGSDNVVRRAEKPNLMPSGKPWVPDYAVNFRDGRSSNAFGRLWWDETVPTVFCFPDPHMRAVVHLEQDRLLTIRECARLQGFHDHYKFYGKLKERYRQVGNAVAVSVGRALGYSLGMAAKRLSGEEHLMTLPPKFSHSTTVQLQSLLNNLQQ